MRVLTLNFETIWGGGPALTIDLIQSLNNEEGMRVVLGCVPESQIGLIAKKAGIETIILPLKNPKDPAAVKHIRNILAYEEFDVIHCHTMWDHFPASIAAKMQKKVKLIRTQHCTYPKKFGFLFKQIYNFFTHSTVCVSNFLKNNLVHHGINSKKISVIYNGINEKKLEKPSASQSFREEMGIGPEKKIITCISNLYKAKGQELLIQAFSTLTEQFPQTLLIIVGDGEYKEALENLARRLDIDEKIIFTGQRLDITRILNSTDIAVVPTLMQESFSLVVAEAMFAGLPVAASRIGAIPELIDENLNGLLFTPGSMEELAENLKKFLSDNELSQNIASAAGKKAAENFTAKRMAKEYINLYQKLSGPGK